jgi:hypothetical protein
LLIRELFDCIYSITKHLYTTESLIIYDVANLILLFSLGSQKDFLAVDGRIQKIHLKDISRPAVNGVVCLLVWQVVLSVVVQKGHAIGTYRK